MIADRNTGQNNRYARQIAYHPIGDEGQARIAQARVAVIGLGALGSVSSELLVRAGAGFVRIVDRDYVSLNNLQRCALYTEQDAADSLPKAVAARQHLAALNSEVVIEEVCTDVNPTTVERLIADVDLVLDATDNFAVRYLLNEACHKWQKTWIYAGVLSAFGSMMVIPPAGPCFRCLSPVAPSPGSYPTCATAGVLASITHILASLQVSEALKIIVGTSPSGAAYVTVDAWNLSLDVITVERDPMCPCCALGEYELLAAASEEPAALANNAPTTSAPASDTPTTSAPANPAPAPKQKNAQSTELCGRDEYQVLPATQQTVDLVALGQRLRSQGAVTVSPFILTFDNGVLRFKLFTDGRAMIKGAKSASAALSLYAEYIGL